MTFLDGLDDGVAPSALSGLAIRTRVSAVSTTARLVAPVSERVTSRVPGATDPATTPVEGHEIPAVLEGHYLRRSTTRPSTTSSARCERGGRAERRACRRTAGRSPTSTTTRRRSASASTPLSSGARALDRSSRGRPAHRGRPRGRGPMEPFARVPTSTRSATRGSRRRARVRLTQTPAADCAQGYATTRTTCSTSTRTSDHRRSGDGIGRPRVGSPVSGLQRTFLFQNNRRARPDIRVEQPGRCRAGDSAQPGRSPPRAHGRR